MLPTARRLAMTTTDTPGTGQQIESNTPLHRGLQLSKITKKNNHVPYNMRSWKCCPPSSTHFWHLFRKCAFTRINSSSEIESISRLMLIFNSSNVWGVCNYYLWRHLKIKCMKHSSGSRRE